MRFWRDLNGRDPQAAILTNVVRVYDGDSIGFAAGDDAILAAASKILS